MRNTRLRSVDNFYLEKVDDKYFIIDNVTDNKVSVSGDSYVVVNCRFISDDDFFFECEEILREG